MKKCNTVLTDSPLYKNTKTFITSSPFLPSGDCAALVQQLKKVLFRYVLQHQFYMNGTFTIDSQIINYGVTLVGYDPTN